MDLAHAMLRGRDWAWIGVDGGASGWRAHRIVARETPAGPRLVTEGEACEVSCEAVPEFAPHDVERQLAGAPDAPGEAEARERWTRAAVRAIERAAEGAGDRPLFVGACAPGLKTDDGRGVRAARNGPRAPRLADEIERRLLASGHRLARPIPRLFSDGLACGAGEEYALGGAFAGVDDAWYLGGGSGLAEASKLDGRLRAVEELEPGILRAWRIPAPGGTFEDGLSIAGLNREAASAGIPGLPEEAALEGEPRARALLARRAERLAEFAARRVAEVATRHGRLLGRIVVAQRLGKLFLDPRLEPWFAHPARAALARRLGAEQRSRVELVGSDLRAAPAIGALAVALERP